jgi:multicomponent Na+:H+ antiporter subunit F
VIHEVVFYAGIAWMAVLLGVGVLVIARGATMAQRILGFDLLSLILVGLLALVAGQQQRSYALDAALGLALLSFLGTLAAARYHGDRRPFS